MYFVIVFANLGKGRGNLGSVLYYGLVYDFNTFELVLFAGNRYVVFLQDIVSQAFEQIVNFSGKKL